VNIGRGEAPKVIMFRYCSRFQRMV
jgi:hypothetical protein